MEQSKFDELEHRAASSAEMDEIKKFETHARVRSVIEEMKAEGKALELSEEEERMLHAFRRFKLRMRKDGDVFTWQTRKPEGLQLAAETAEILDPSEV